MTQSAAHNTQRTPLTSSYLAFDLTWDDLYTPTGLAKLDQTFITELSLQNADIAQQLQGYRQSGIKPARDDKAHANFLMQLVPYVDDFLSALFQLYIPLSKLKEDYLELGLLARVKRQFMQRLAWPAYQAQAAAAQLDGITIWQNLQTHFAISSTEVPMTMGNGEHTSLAEDLYLAQHIVAWQAQADNSSAQKALELAKQYGVWRMYRIVHGLEASDKNDAILYKIPKKLAPGLYVEAEISTDASGATYYHVQTGQLRQRIGVDRKGAFSLTDAVFGDAAALDESHYCIHCHAQGKDSCSKGLLDKKTDAPGLAQYKKSSSDVPLVGCPLEERISEFHQAKTQGHILAALGLICLDNPMAITTGHRICNDCMKACIYQKQQAVDIPQAETHTLETILSLPFGFEIYSLLTRWNPFNMLQPIAQAPTGRSVLVVGAGPAGYTLAHHLLNQGHAVCLIDALKIEPMPAAYLPTMDDNHHHAHISPIFAIENLYQDLHTRRPGGFGGVSEYGITVRWNKNFLDVARLLLERRAHFTLLGGLRFGGKYATLDQHQAFALGFDHIALAMGAGKPRLVEMKDGRNSLPKGVRTASDFLMSVQSNAAFREDVFAHVQVRLPIVVIGGGLTAMDCATESLAYYITQVKKFAQQYQTLQDHHNHDNDNIQKNWTLEQQQLAAIFITHAHAIHQEETLAQKEQRTPRITQLLQNWGGASVLYRKGLSDAPAYRLNHEEVQKALEEGIYFIEHVTPIGYELDAHQHVAGVRCQTTTAEKKEIIIAAQTVYIAAGTQANIVLAQEDADIAMDDQHHYFKACNVQGEAMTPDFQWVKNDQGAFFNSFYPDGRAISFIGDLHPSYFGNVVKAMASSKHAAPHIGEALAQLNTPKHGDAPLHALQNSTHASIRQIRTLAPNIIELVMHAPYQAQHFQPGQFYRLQNYEASAPSLGGQKLTIEPLALTGAWVDVDQGLIACIALTMGTSSTIIEYLNIGEAVVLMGPTGTPTHIAQNKTVLLIGGGLGNAVLFSIAQALQMQGSRVIYFAGYKKLQDVYYQDRIENHSDHVIWCCDEAAIPASPHRLMDYSVHGTMLDALDQYMAGNFAACLPVADVDEVLVIGSDGLMAAIAHAVKNRYAAYFKADVKTMASINSPMQCMMKEICGQCIQRHVVDGKEHYIFSCHQQDQDLRTVDFAMLRQRLMQNALLEDVGRQYLGIYTS